MLLYRLCNKSDVTHHKKTSTTYIKRFLCKILLISPSLKSHNASNKRPLMHHSATVMCTQVHSSVTNTAMQLDWYIVSPVNWFNSGAGHVSLNGLVVAVIIVFQDGPTSMDVHHIRWIHYNSVEYQALADCEYQLCFMWITMTKL